MLKLPMTPYGEMETNTDTEQQSRVQFILLVLSYAFLFRVRDFHISTDMHIFDHKIVIIFLLMSLNVFWVLKRSVEMVPLKLNCSFEYHTTYGLVEQ